MAFPEDPYGNVDIREGVPKGFVHCEIPRAGLTCRAVGIDYRRAFIGFDKVKRRPVPVFSGIVIREEDEAALEQALAAKKQHPPKTAEQRARERERKQMRDVEELIARIARRGSVRRIVRASVTRFGPFKNRAGRLILCSAVAFESGRTWRRKGIIMKMRY